MMGQNPVESSTETVAVQFNGQPRAFSVGTTVAGMIAQLGLQGRPVAVEVNHAVVPRRLHDERVLEDGDRIELVTLVGGG